MLSYPTPLEIRILANMDDDCLMRAVENTETAWHADPDDRVKMRTACVFVMEAARRELIR